MYLCVIFKDEWKKMQNIEFLGLFGGVISERYPQIPTKKVSRRSKRYAGGRIGESVKGLCSST